MIILVVGASGLTGSLLVEWLIKSEENHEVRVIVRSEERFHARIKRHKNIHVVAEAPILDLSDEKLEECVKDCHAVVSCLGHVMSLGGIFGRPRNLCTEATRRLCMAIKKCSPLRDGRGEGGTPCPPCPKFILMNTVGVSNQDRKEPRSLFDRALLTVLRCAIPPHADNENAAAYLQNEVGKMEDHFTWCIVRPDSLINEDVSDYVMTKSPSTSITNGIPTSRANVAHFMSILVERDDMWNDWKFQMPVITNLIPFEVEEAKEPTRGDRDRQVVEKPTKLETRLINDNNI